MPQRHANLALTLMQLISGAWISQAIFAAAKLGVADFLADGPKPLSVLAEETGSNAASLYRLLRALASVGLFVEMENGSFGLTPLASCLQTGVDGSLRSYAIMMGSEWAWQSWGAILHSVETGEPAFQKIYGAPLFDYYQANPEAGRISFEGLASRSGIENAAVLSAYDFSSARRIVDIGGGRGALVAALLRAHPDVSAELFDLPHVIAAARETLNQPDISARCSFIAGDFFASMPAGADIYLMKKVIHDWDDENSRAILRQCRKAMPHHGRLLLLEHVVPPGNDPSYAKLIDLLMLVLAGGRERTALEYDRLLASAGLRTTSVTPILGSLNIIEAMRAEGEEAEPN